MTPQATRDLVHAYYAAWAARDKEAARTLMAADMRHVSVWGLWESAAAHPEEFESLSDGIAAIELIREVYGAARRSCCSGWS